ncbi:flavodoxin [Levilactobacillus zymae]|uniref:flavodoxin n=1 Tax=Levilactobacillus zymae TaxID=267363 RepID=UPI0028B7B72D|nr:flavodoxin [Levilactobacillus zymae]MDT6980228.1 flavodoxin [Levilactobacillus zymae]
MIALIEFSLPGETLVHGPTPVVHVGHTARVARLLGDRLNVSPLSLQPQTTYPVDYEAVLRRAKLELTGQALPAIQPLSSTTLQAPIWFLGYPIWFGHVPRVIATLLTQVPTPPKVIYPFVTHEGSGLGQSMADLQRLCPTAVVQPGLPIRGSRVARAAPAVDHWLQSYFDQPSIQSKEI